MTTLAAVLFSLLPLATPDADDYFAITVVDQQTGRGVPLVELRTVGGVRHYTDSNGLVAFHEPGLMGRRVFFHVSSHGYEFPADGFGSRGKAFDVTPGGSARLTIRRVNVAKRLYRVTGGGIYRDSVLLGRNVPIEQPVLNGMVLGQDSVLTTVYRGRIYWFWGDTNRPGYPLGNFHAPGATSRLPGQGGLDPDVGVNLDYFLDERGFAKETARMPGEGPTWLDALVVLRDDDNRRERMFARYVKVAKPMRVYQRGLVEFDDERRQFVKLAEFDMQAPLTPAGHPIKHDVDGTAHLYFHQLTRVRATPADLADLSRYETFTCFKEGSRVDAVELDRDATGRLRYAWRRDTASLTPKLQAELIAADRLEPDEGWWQIRDVATGEPVTPQHGSVCYNPYRHRWIRIFSQLLGSSVLGEVWYAEADTPIGPWVYARKIVTHEKYSFYNPRHHPMFDKHGGREIFFEGTYTHTFSGNPDRTPRYDYNQIMYKLDLTDERLTLPVAVYRLTDAAGGERFGLATSPPSKSFVRPVAFFAPDRPMEETLPVYQVRTADGQWRLHVGQRQGASEPLFHALPSDTQDPSPETVPLWEFVDQAGKQRVYTTDKAWQKPGYQRTDRPLCRVWRNPIGNVELRDRP